MPGDGHAPHIEHRTHSRRYTLCTHSAVLQLLCQRHTGRKSLTAQGLPVAAQACKTARRVRDEDSVSSEVTRCHIRPWVWRKAGHGCTLMGGCPERVGRIQYCQTLPGSLPC
jgi:hypothetical protein